MGRRGPRPTPAVLQLERGTRSHHAPNREEPQLAAVSDLKPPKGMKGRALATWKRLGKHLVDLGVITEGDTDAFESYCYIVGQVAAVERKVAAMTLEEVQRLGYLNALIKLRAQQKQYAAELGLTPSSRSAVKVVKPKGDAGQAAKRQRFFGNRSTG